MPDASNDYRKAAIEHLQILKGDIVTTCVLEGWRILVEITG